MTADTVFIPTTTTTAAAGSMSRKAQKSPSIHMPGQPEPKIRFPGRHDAPQSTERQTTRPPLSNGKRYIQCVYQDDLQKAASSLVDDHDFSDIYSGKDIKNVTITMNLQQNMKTIQIRYAKDSEYDGNDGYGRGNRNGYGRRYRH